MMIYRQSSKIQLICSHLMGHPSDLYPLLILGVAQQRKCTHIHKRLVAVVQSMLSSIRAGAVRKVKADAVTRLW